MPSNLTELPGNFDGRHFSTYVDQVKTLRRLKRDDCAAALLLRLLPVIEEEAVSRGPRWPVAPWYYEQLAIIYKKAKRFEDEVGILKRYVDAHACIEEKPFEKLVQRLQKAELGLR
ncbi:hypothetical protein [Rhodoferax fermentans]|uniref:Uncharacterized protein n=1 Tax=Rhodoferax fermentans TaxID=28066 RepID=A0A1T1ANI0_RHOFE|nr:hypothetical protein [Rhodoferax fermentans]MBK1685537.1 hypothetical protein [Rhodoferax fermentans]OOV05659.1 hypothetical protein RF819_02085 [Rhodoferax fermentans]